MGGNPGSRDGLAVEEWTRYGRHLVLPEVGIDGQLRLRAASVVVVGAGGLGSPLALYLAAAGIGRIGLVDFDAVDLSNLQRQILYATSDVGRLKTEAARERIEGTNPHVRVETHATRLTVHNALDILGRYDVCADGSDNFATRYLVNDACVRLGRPNVYGAVFRFEGQVSVFASAGGPCYRCLFPEPPAPGVVPSCAEGGVLGVLPGVVGALQANEVLKLVLGRGEPLVGRLLLFHALEGRFRELRLARDPDCPACGAAVRCAPLGSTVESCGPPPPASSVQRMGAAELAARRAAVVLLDVRSAEERAICRIEGDVWIPLAELPERICELDPQDEIVVYCHAGIRSHSAAALLGRHGFARAASLAGGIDAWAAEVDPALPRY